MSELELLSRTPLVVSCDVGADRDLATLAQRLAAAFPDTRFICVVAAESDTEARRVFDGLGPRLAEIIVTTGCTEDAVDRELVIDLALGRFRQDFVFTVVDFTAAIDHGVAALSDTSNARWEGDALLIAGTGASLDQARARFPSASDDQDR